MVGKNLKCSPILEYVHVYVFDTSRICNFINRLQNFLINLGHKLLT